jgi:hypothetical protein
MPVARALRPCARGKEDRHESRKYKYAMRHQLTSVCLFVQPDECERHLSSSVLDRFGLNYARLLYDGANPLVVLLKIFMASLLAKFTAFDYDTNNTTFMLGLC